MQEINGTNVVRGPQGGGGPNRSWRRIGLVTGILGGLLTSMVAFATPASAVFHLQVQRVSATSVSDSNSPKTATAVCPGAKRLVGTGAEINWGLGEVLIDDLRPNGGPGVAPTSVSVTAYEEDPYASNWSVTAYAICANPLAGLERLSATSVAGSSDFAGATATCPSTKKLLGTGFALNGSVTGAWPNAIGHIVTDDLRPNGGPATAPTSVFVGAYEAEPYANAWSVTAYAICANAAAVPGLVRISNTSGLAAADSQSTSAACGAKHLVGTGAEINGAGGEVILDDLRPSGVPVSSNFVTGFAADPPPPAWTITSYAICANP